MYNVRYDYHNSCVTSAFRIGIRIMHNRRDICNRVIIIQLLIVFGFLIILEFTPRSYILSLFNTTRILQIQVVLFGGKGNNMISGGKRNRPSLGFGGKVHRRKKEMVHFRWCLTVA